MEMLSLFLEIRRETQLVVVGPQRARRLHKYSLRDNTFSTGCWCSWHTREPCIFVWINRSTMHFLWAAGCLGPAESQAIWWAMLELPWNLPGDILGRLSPSIWGPSRGATLGLSWGQKSFRGPHSQITITLLFAPHFRALLSSDPGDVEALVLYPCLGEFLGNFGA